MKLVKIVFDRHTESDGMMHIFFDNGYEDLGAFNVNDDGAVVAKVLYNMAKRINRRQKESANKGGQRGATMKIVKG